MSPNLIEQIKKAKAAVAQPAVVAQPAITQPSLLSTAQPAAIVAQPAAVAGAGPALGGGDRLALVMDALKTAKVGGGRNDLPNGTGIFLLKTGKFIITDDGKWKISIFSFLCLQGIKDAAGLTYGVEGYTGPIQGDTYDVSLFQDFGPKYVKATMRNNLNALSACMGWTQEQVKKYQATPEGLATLAELLQGMMCCSMADCVPTNEPSIFSNQVVIQLTRSTKIIEQKDPVTKQPLYADNQGTKATKPVSNEYWDKKVPLADLSKVIGDDAKIIEAFGTAEAFQAALTNEQALAGAFP